MHTQVLVIGSGPAGYTAAIYAARAGLSTTLISGLTVGGQLTKTHEVENYPGFLKISGFDLMENFKTQAEHVSVHIILEEVKTLTLDKKPFKYQLSNGLDGFAETVIIATGTSSKWLNTNNEDKFKGNGISICATCDGFFYKNKSVAVIGGGNTALYEALFLSNIAQNVFLININKDFKGEKNLIERVKTNKKIKIYNDTELIDFIGENKLTAIKIKNKRNKSIQELNVSGVFEAIGSVPNTNLVKNQLKITKNGYIKTNKRTMETSIEGVFACGDVQESIYKQAVISAGSGAIAALSAEKYLIRKDKKEAI